MISEKRMRALRILADAGPDGLTPAQFAERMWPDSPRWQTVYHVGNGAARGVAVNRSGGAYLGRLRRDGLTAQAERDGHWRHTLTAAGRAALRTGEDDS